jgi:hypothetical protein
VEAELLLAPVSSAPALAVAWTCYYYLGEDLRVDVGERDTVVGAIILDHVADGLRLHCDRLPKISSRPTCWSSFPGD